MNLLDMLSVSILGALGCNMDTFLRYFPAAEMLYSVFIALAVGLMLLNLVWQTFRNFGLGLGLEAEDPVKLVMRTGVFMVLAFFGKDITDMALAIGGTPYAWILGEELPAISFADFNSVLLTIVGVVANGSVALIALLLLIVLAWNLSQAIVRGSGKICTAGCAGLYSTGCLCYGCQQINRKHI